jgi:hypothetical protein
MSTAAFELINSKAKVIDISMKYGYESPEAFTRAFKEIYGVSPSMARKDNVVLRSFPRISFQLTIKGEVIMDYSSESNGVKVVNSYYEHMPALRLIGKRYTHADLDPDMKFGSKWNEWFQKRWFEQLNELGCLKGHDNTVIFGIHIGDEIGYWIGMFFSEETAVPEEFDYADIPAGVVGMSWLHGYKENGELFSQSAHEMCREKLIKAGNTVKMDFDGEPCKWSFERYHNERYNFVDKDGKIIMDYGIYLVETEENNGNLTSVQEETFPSKLLTEEMPCEYAPEVLISNMGPYSVEFENNLLFCALTTLFLKLDGYDESKPYYCPRQDSICNQCKSCGDMSEKSSLVKYHMDLYNYLITVSSVGLMWEDADTTGSYDMKYIEGVRLTNVEDRLDFAMKLKGYEYISLDRTKGERDISDIVKKSIHQDIPVLLKLNQGSEWCVVTGIDEKTNTLYGLDSRNAYNVNRNKYNRNYTKDGLFAINDWMKNLRKVIVVTGKSNTKVDFQNQIKRMTERMMSSKRSDLETLTLQLLDSIEADNAYGIANYLLKIVGYGIETRWYASECFGTSLAQMADSQANRVTLQEASEIYHDTHDMCWGIWGLLGVGPHTNFQLPNLIGTMMLERDRQEKLKESFAKIFQNDVRVLEKLQAILLK